MLTVLLFTYSGVTVFVSIRVGYRHNDPVIVIDQVVIGDIDHQLFDGEECSWKSNPFTSMEKG